MRQWLILPTSFILTFGAGYVGSFFTQDKIYTWYPTLVKPTLNPPDWVFGPVWIVLYALMTVALYRIWRLAHYRKDARVWTALFIIHLFFNAWWSILFFGLESPLLAFIDIMLLWGLLVVLVYRAWWIDNIATYFLIPYLVWISYAAYLNVSIVFLN